MPHATLTLKRFIFSATFVVSVVTFMIVILTVSWIFMRQAEDTFARFSRSMAGQIYSSIFQTMEDGGTRQDMARILDTYQRSFPNHYSMEMLVGQPLKRLKNSSLKHGAEPYLSGRTSTTYRKFHMKWMQETHCNTNEIKAARIEATKTL